MKKIFRLIGLTLVVAIAFLAVAIGAFVALFDPNAYKDDLSSLVRDATGRDLQFHGDVELTIYPALGMKLGSMSLSNAPGFGAQPMVKVAAASVSVDVKSLLAMAPEIEKLVLRDLEVNLVRNQAGVTNWDDLVKPAADDASGQQAGGGQGAAQGAGGGDLQIQGAFGGLDLQNIRVSWLDEQAGQRYEITDLDLGTGRIVPNQPFPLTLHLVVQGDVDVTVDLKSNIEYLIEQQQLTLDGIDLALNRFGIRGRVQLADFAAPTPALRFDLQSEELDVDALLGIPPAAPEAAADGMADDEAAADIEIALPMELLRGLDIDGRLRIAELKAQNLRLANVDLALKAADGQVGIAPLTADGYGGKFRGEVGVDVTRDNPRYRIEQSLAGVRVGELLKDFTGEDRILGNANLEASLTTRGTRLSRLRRNLNGTLEIAFLDGALNGFNLRHEIERAKAKLRGQKPPAAQTLRTDFSSLKLSGVIENGVFKSDDLDILRARVDAEKEKLKAEIDAKKAALEAEIAAEKQKLEDARRREIENQKAALEARQKAAEEEARRKADARRQKAEDEAKEKLQDKLDNLLN